MEVPTYCQQRYYSGRFPGQSQISVIGQRITSALLKMTLLGCLGTKLSPILLCMDAGAFVVHWHRVLTWEPTSSSGSLKSSFSDFLQTFKGFVWFYMKLRDKRLWLVMYCSERLCKKPSMTDSGKHAYFASLKFSHINILSNKEKTLSLDIS